MPTPFAIVRFLEDGVVVGLRDHLTVGFEERECGDVVYVHRPNATELETAVIIGIGATMPEARSSRDQYMKEVSKDRRQAAELSQPQQGMPHQDDGSETDFSGAEEYFASLERRKKLKKRL